MHSALALSAREIRRRNRARVPVLWGATRRRRRQFGSVRDLRLARVEAVKRPRRLIVQVRGSVESFARSMRQIDEALKTRPADFRRLAAQARAKAGEK